LVHDKLYANCGAIAVTASTTYMTIMELSANGCNLCVDMAWIRLQHKY